MVTRSLTRSFDRSNLIETKSSLYVKLNIHYFFTHVNQLNKIYLAKIQFFYLFYFHSINLLNIKKEHIKKCALRPTKILSYFDGASHKQLKRS